MSVPRTSAVWPPNEALTQQPLVAGTTLVARGTGGADSITYPRATPSTVTSLMLSEAFLAEGIYTIEVGIPVMPLGAAKVFG